jgi:hypothetical protein
MTIGLKYSGVFPTPCQKRRAMELRPLGFGEIFDRAITLYLRNFVAFAGIVAVVIVPLAVLQYFIDLSSLPQWDQMIQIFEHPAKTPPPVAPPAFLTSPGVAGLYILVVFVAWAMWPFALNACAVGVAKLYRGRPVEFVACYRASLRRWPSVFGLLLVELFIFIAWYVAFLVVIFASALMVALLIRASVPLGVVAVIAVIAFVIILLLSLAPLFVALTFAMNSIVIEERHVFDAIRSGFARIFNREEIWRSLLFAVCAVAILGGAGMLAGAIGLAALFFHWVWLEVLVTSFFRAAITPFSIVLLAVYYFDVRIRREGLDLEAELERMTSGSQVA